MKGIENRVHPRALDDTALHTVLTDATIAREHVFKLCSHEARFTMSIPVMAQDSDVILLRGLDAADRLVQEVYRLRGEIKEVLIHASQGDLSDEVRERLMTIMFNQVPDEKHDTPDEKTIHRKPIGTPTIDEKQYRRLAFLEKEAAWPRLDDRIGYRNLAKQGLVEELVDDQGQTCFRIMPAGRRMLGVKNEGDV